MSGHTLWARPERKKEELWGTLAEDCIDEMFKKDLKIILLALSPLIVFINLLPVVSSISLKLLFGLEFELIAFLGLKYRKSLVELNLRTKKERLEIWRRIFNFNVILGIIFSLVIGVFFLLSYLSEVLNR